MSVDEKKAAIAERIQLEMLRASTRARVTDHSPSWQEVTFRPLAAAPKDETLPKEVAADEDRLMSIGYTLHETGIAVKVKAVGFARSNAVRKRPARFVSQDGKIDYLFRFDVHGVAEFQLTREAHVLEALRGTVLVLIENG